MTQKMLKTFSKLSRLKSFEERYEYLRLGGIVGEETFGGSRYLNQEFYTSAKWRRTRRGILLRDDGLDLGSEEFEIPGLIVVHHINPITDDDILEDRDCLYDPENLISCSDNTHRAIHFGDSKLLPKILIERTPGDTCPWK